MKRLNKKQKLIVTIAIILIAVILAIVITTNIISNNSQIANEGYSATTTNANSNLVASYIKNGVKVGGITGTLEVLKEEKKESLYQVAINMLKEKCDKAMIKRCTGLSEAKISKLEKSIQNV